MRANLLIRISVMIAAIGLVLFASAGRLDVPFFWAYLAFWLVSTGYVLTRLDLELLQERFKRSVPSRDNLPLLRGLAATIFISHWIVAGLDAGRFHWSGSVPLWAQVCGFAGFAGGLSIWFWAMSVNPFFSPGVRIQAERGHRVISKGPYRFVRHPGYAALCILGPCSGLALGSWWAMLPPVTFSLLFVRRTLVEDLMLRLELGGYADYARRVPFRLVPGVW